MNPQTTYVIVEMLIFIAIFYFLLILPQQRRQKKEREMLDSLKPGDEIITKSGFYGKILNIKDDVITLEMGADKVRLKIAKWAVGGVISSASDKNEKEEK
ncbi:MULTISPECIES: preprotein translocase subunit YajC [Thermoanaerobacter]|uniref:Preprotein translocase, YajC subunit n=1 Tax=Thermoanaerobacter wiegelii Rt8.B1 TaxID=697303 RepID=G2MSZ8_9THEO|nr:MULTISPECIES: preprotein translocase subunit YajC [Thermoanaerobacter]AEM78584.1 preprotein translocase, YajC subunit [Thermoanaerobacter wiegelii Rt8.B1]KHO62309.1 preprotein translocase subunit YajC [Thermoanaerobacter sp. YS13]